MKAIHNTLFIHIGFIAVTAFMTAHSLYMGTFNLRYAAFIQLITVLALIMEYIRHRPVARKLLPTIVTFSYAIQLYFSWTMAGKIYPEDVIPFVLWFVFFTLWSKDKTTHTKLEGTATLYVSTALFSYMTIAFLQGAMGMMGMSGFSVHIAMIGGLPLILMPFAYIKGKGKIVGWTALITITINTMFLYVMIADPSFTALDVIFSIYHFIAIPASTACAIRLILRPECAITRPQTGPESLNYQESTVAC